MKIYDWLIEGRRDLKIKEAVQMTLFVIGAIIVCFIAMMMP